MTGCNLRRPPMAGAASWLFHRRRTKFLRINRRGAGRFRRRQGRNSLRLAALSSSAVEEARNTFEYKRLEIQK
jgi:hypothetical protein